MEKLVPQPQDEVALGLSIVNLAPISASLKSIMAPAKKPNEIGSITTLAPFLSNTVSSSDSISSYFISYWKPEQPPPSTATRKHFDAPISKIRLKALSVTFGGNFNSIFKT